MVELVLSVVIQDSLVLLVATDTPLLMVLIVEFTKSLEAMEDMDMEVTEDMDMEATEDMKAPEDMDMEAMGMEAMKVTEDTKVTEDMVTETIILTDGNTMILIMLEPKPLSSTVPMLFSIHDLSCIIDPISLFTDLMSSSTDLQ